ncbi:TPA: 28S ribosomal protein S6, mitochondrial [Trebouxia sp. C0006]
MPVYELFCLARPQITKKSLAAVIKTASNAVFSNSGVMTDIQSYGNRDLAYPIRKAGSKYNEAEMWQMNFLVRPAALPKIHRNLQIDEDVLRWIFIKKRQHPVNPNTHTVAKQAQRRLDERGVHLIDSAQQHVAPH